MRIAQGATWDRRTKTLRLSVYVTGSRGAARARKTIQGVATQKDAERLAAAFRAKVDRDGCAPGRVPTLQEFVDEYFDQFAPRLSEKTVADYKLVLRTRVLPKFGAMRLTAITSGLVNLWVAQLSGEGLAGASVNHIVNVLRAIVGKAVKYEAIPESPFRRPIDRAEVNLPENELDLAMRKRFLQAFDDIDAFQESVAARQRKGATVVPRKRFKAARSFGGSRRPDSVATKEVFQRLRATKPFFVLALTTGLRLSDLLSLQWKHVQIHEGLIERKTSKTGRLVTIPISEECAEALQELEQRRIPVVAAERDEQIVVVDESGRPLSLERIRKAFARAKAIAGIEKLRIHDLRHTYCSGLASEGLSLPTISRVAGHASIRQTERYARADARVLDDVREAQDRIGRAMRKHRATRKR